MRFVFTLVLTVIVWGALAQRKYITGQVLDQERSPIPGVHIINKNSGSITASDLDGNFTTTAQPGDTLELTRVGLMSLMIAYDENWPEDGLKLFMREGTIGLDEITIHSIPPIELFKERVIEQQVEDSVAFWYFGVEKPVFKGDKMAEGEVHKKLLYAVVQPTSFLYYNLSKSEKEKRKFRQIQKNQLISERSDLKYTREWVSEHTRYKDEELTSFIAYCNYSPQFISRTPLYLIMEDMMEKKKSFEKSKEK